MLRMYTFNKEEDINYMQYIYQCLHNIVLLLKYKDKC